MLVIDHILSCFVIALIPFVAGVKREKMLAFLLGLLLIQLIDLDHYSGDSSLMLRCGLVLETKDPILPLCQETLYRGVLHEWVVFDALFFGLLLSSLNKRHQLVMWLVGGMIVGWVAHMVLDGLLF